LEENEQQQLKIVDIDEIPSLEMIQINSTLILEEIQKLEAKAMKVDTPTVTQQHQRQEEETQKEEKSESIEAALEANRKAQNPETTVEPDGSQTSISEQPARETVEYASAWPEWLMGEQPKVVGTLNQPPQ
jgi:hypothetical protein